MCVCVSVSAHARSRLHVCICVCAHLITDFCRISVLYLSSHAGMMLTQWPYCVAWWVHCQHSTPKVQTSGTYCRTSPSSFQTTLSPCPLLSPFLPLGCQALYKLSIHTMLTSYSTPPFLPCLSSSRGMVDILVRVPSVRATNNPSIFCGAENCALI
jgi:hypothetical protein